MRGYFRGLVLGLGLVWLGGCTSVDDTLGQGFIPVNQQMVLRMGNVAPFDAYLALNDSVPASGQGSMFIGSTRDAVFGTTVASAMTDFFPARTDWNEGVYFGGDPTVDSVFLDVLINSVVGDWSVEQTFNVYSMTDSLKRDSTYKMNTPDLASKRGAKLFTFKLSNKFPAGAATYVRMEPTAAGNTFINSLVAVPTDVYATPWPRFREQFNGLLIEPDDPTLNAAIYELELRSGLAGFVMYYHYTDLNKKSTEAEDDNVDTVYVGYDFRDTYWYDKNNKSIMPNVSVNSVKFGWPSAIADNIVNPAGEEISLAGKSPVTTGYVQGLGGVLTYLKVSQALKDWFASAKSGYSDLVIQRAILEIPLADPTAEKMDAATSRMGMYYLYGKGTPLLDYDYVTENSSYYSSATIPYGGYIARSKGWYSMNITQWLTYLMLYPDLTTQEIWLAPEILTRADTLSQTALDLAKIKLTVTYTLIK